ncbi:amidase [Candidatus Poriferisocius sp.]|uniref:amidase n=1 Tax=Candidatus Poriferisocius sp. TaxID=3101276 RepID=UPI003B590FFD
MEEAAEKLMKQSKEKAMEETMDFRVRSVEQWAAAVRSREVSARDLAEGALAAIEAHRGLNAFVVSDPERSLAEADRIDTRLAAGDEVGPLAGIPIGVKDLEDAAGYVTSQGSKLHADDPPAVADSVLVERLRHAGCVVMGKTNTPEFGWTGDTYNPLFGPTGNPWNPTRSPGGSSGGTAAALMAGLVPLCTGSDGGGSIRIPAAACGFSGFKASLGRVPVEGPYRLWPLSVHGPMALRVADIAFVQDLVMGPSPRDLHSLPRPEQSWHQALEESRRPQRVVWCPSPDGNPSDAEVVAVCEAAVAQLEADGVAVEVRDEALFNDPIWEYVLLSSNAVSSELGGLTDEQMEQITPGLRYFFGLSRSPEVADFNRALDIFYAMSETLNELLSHAELLLTPTVAGHFPDCGGQGLVNGERVDNWIRHTYPYNLTRLPAGSVRAGFAADGMPVGLQLVGPQLADVAVLQAMAYCEQLFAPTMWPELS